MVKKSISRLQTDGVRLICKKAQEGPTGALLKEIIPYEDLTYYAQEYVDSAVQSLQCILRVQLG
jgi:hypothetical protein